MAVVVPPDRIDQSTLTRLLEEFVTRDGTDYGEEEVSLQVKVEQVQHAVRHGEVLIIFDELSETFDLVTREQWQQVQGQMDD